MGSPRLALLTAVAAAALAAASACAHATAAPPATPAPPAGPPPVTVSLDTKVSWILQLEQQRLLRDMADTSAALPPGSDLRDLSTLAADPNPAVRRRALLAIGRVGMAAGRDALEAGLKDGDADVRAAAAFGLGLIGAKEAVPALQAAIADASLTVRTRVLDALGLIADPGAAPAVAAAMSGCAAVVAPVEPDVEIATVDQAEFCKAGYFALVRLVNYDALASVALDAQGQPVARWWPIAYALQRINDRRAANALAVLATTPGVYTASFALRGLAGARDARAVTIGAPIAERVDADLKLRIAAVRALGQVGGRAATDALLAVLKQRNVPLNLAIEATTALGATADPRALPALLELFTDRDPALRAAALAAAAKVDQDAFLLVLSSFGRDKDWSVRAALASVLATMPGDVVAPALDDLTQDEDVRVRPAALRGLARVKGPTLARRLFEALDTPDFAVRSAAAELIGEQKIEGGVPRLVAAYARAQSDATYAARASALEGASRYDGDAATSLLEQGLTDPDWAVRVRAAELLRAHGRASAQPGRPAPLRQGAEAFDSPRILHPAYSPHAFLETSHGTIEIELNVVEAALTTQTFIELARAGFYNGIHVHRLVPGFVIQAGDPRGDGEGGPGYAIRDELSPLPYLRGTVGMALSWKDTGGSQFFITLGPQPHLDGKYTVFGHVVNGFDFLDKVEVGDTILRVRIWDGTSFQ